MNENIKGAINHVLQEKFGGNRSKMARALGFSPQQVAQWVVGSSSPSDASSLKLAKFLGTGFEELRDGDAFVVKTKSVDERLMQVESRLEHLEILLKNDDDIAEIVKILNSSTVEFRRAARKMIDSLRESF